MGSKKSTTNKTTSSTNLPGFVTDAGQQATDMGRAIGNRQYTPYFGQRTANLSNNESRAVNLAAGGNGRAQQMVEQGTKLLDAGKNWDEATDSERKAYEDPIFEATARPAIDAANTSYGRQKQNLGASKELIAAKGGADALNLTSQAMDQNLNETTGDLDAQGRYQAYQGAQQQFGADQDRQRAVGQALIAAGGDYSKLNAQQIQDLMMTGGTQRMLSQQNLDFDYGKFLENRDWDITNLRPLLASLQGTQGSYGYSTTQTGKQPTNPLGQILGAATAGAGMYFGSRGSGGGQSGATGMGANVGGNYNDWLTSGVAV